MTSLVSPDVPEMRRIKRIHFIGIGGAGIARHRTFPTGLAHRFCLKYDQAPAV